MKILGSEDIINKHRGERITLGLKRANGVFFTDYTLKEATATHLFVSGPRGEEALLLSEIIKIEFHSAAGGRV